MNKSDKRRMLVRGIRSSGRDLSIVSMPAQIINWSSGSKTSFLMEKTHSTHIITHHEQL